MSKFNFRIAEEVKNSNFKIEIRSHPFFPFPFKHIIYTHRESGAGDINPPKYTHTWPLKIRSSFFFALNSSGGTPLFASVLQIEVADIKMETGSSEELRLRNKNSHGW